MKAFTKISCLLILSFHFISCDNDKIPGPSIEIMTDKIVCEKCNGFGSIIEADGNDLVVADLYNHVFIFEYQNQELVLNKSIGFEKQTGILSVVLKDGILLFSHPDEDGTGIVYIYEKRSSDWEEIQKLTIGRHQDNFGSAMDISDDYLIIGANAPYIDNLDSWVNTDEGIIYIYHKSSSGYVLERKFKAQDSHAADGFGSTVAIQGDIILAGGNTPIHIYQYDGEWKFLKTEPLHTGNIVHYENKFIAIADIMFYAFSVDQNGDYTISNEPDDFIDQDFYEQLGIIEVYKNYLLFESHNYCYILEYLNNEWTNSRKIEPASNQCSNIAGIELTDDKIYMGGQGDDYKDYVYMLEY